MKPLFILADDLTGAADSAARCRSAGLPATIYLTTPSLPLPAGVMAFTSDSRHLTAAAAATRVRQVSAPLCDQEAVWYKKIDSTLRGNIGSELDALLDLLNLPCAVICPAFPAQGRGLRDGYLAAPSIPAQTLHLPTLLRAQSRYPVAEISLADLWAGDARARIQTAASTAALLVCDAMTDADLAQIVQLVADVIQTTLLCGSAGSVGAWVRQGGEAANQASAQTEQASAQTVIVMGSGSEMAHRQVAALCKDANVLCEVVTQNHDAESVDRCVAANRAVTLVQLPPPAAGMSLDGPQARGWADRLAEIAVAVVQKMQPTRLILTGGDTAINVLTRLGIGYLTVLAEVLPGMPLCLGTAANGRTYQVIMKPGSFGDEQTLVELAQKGTMD